MRGLENKKIRSFIFALIILWAMGYFLMIKGLIDTHEDLKIKINQAIQNQEDLNLEIKKNQKKLNLINQDNLKLKNLSQKLIMPWELSSMQLKLSEEALNLGLIVDTLSLDNKNLNPEIKINLRGGYFSQCAYLKKIMNEYPLIRLLEFSMEKNKLMLTWRISLLPQSDD